jgi:hypothetical protein
MTTPQHYEKGEKDEKTQQEEKVRQEQEKSEEKQEEKHGEKNWEEKWRRDPLRSVTWAAVLIWAGLVLLGENLGLLVNLRRLVTGPSRIFFARAEAWMLIFTGAGVLVLLEAIVRLVVPAYRRPVAGSIILGAVLLGIGLGDIVGWATIWPLILIGGGLILLLQSLIGRR